MTKKEMRECAIVRTAVNSLGVHLDHIYDRLDVLRRKIVYLASYSHCIHDDDVLDTISRIIYAFRDVEAEATSAASEGFISLNDWLAVPSTDKEDKDEPTN